MEVERIPRPLTNSSPSFSQPLPNSYWATPYLVACEYPWSPPCASFKNINGIAHPSIDLRLSFINEAPRARPRWRAHIYRPYRPLRRALSYSPLLPVLSSALTAATGEDIQLDYYRVPIEDRAPPLVRRSHQAPRPPLLTRSPLPRTRKIK